MAVLSAVASIILLGLVLLSIRAFLRHRKFDDPLMILCAVLLLSCLAVLASFFVLDLSRKAKYYFVYFILISILVSCLYEECGRREIRILVCVEMVLVLCVAYIYPIYSMETSTSVYEEMAQYMEDNNYEIVYSIWDDAGNVAGASGCRITAGRWDASNIFQIKAHTNVMGIYSEKDNEKALYLMTDSTLQEAREYLKKSNVDANFCCVATFTDEMGNNKYLYKSDKQLLFP